jgi:hypothetical protein
MTMYYKETERTYDFMDGQHYHTDNVIWIVEDNGLDSEGIKRYFVVKHYIEPLGNYKTEYLLSEQDLGSDIISKHLEDITEKDAFIELL